MKICFYPDTNIEKKNVISTSVFQHMRKKHHIEIVMREDGSTTCYVANETIISAASNGGVGSSHSLLSQQTAHSSDSMVNVLPITDLISTVAQVG